MSAPELTVVLPTLNEAEALKALLPRVQAAFKTLGVSGEILVVDGKSKDGTSEVAARLGARVQSQRGRGYGSALREGLESAAAPFAVVMDADGSHPPEALGALWSRREEADLVIASRYMPGGEAAMPLLRQVLSRSLNRVTARVLDLPIGDSSSGFRLYRRALLKDLGSSATDFTVQQDLLARLLSRGARVVEVPFRYEPRLAGASKASALRLAPAYLRMFARLKPLRGGWRAESGLALALAIGLATGLCGITGGLPGPERLRALPQQARSSPQLIAALTEGWRRLYGDIRRARDNRDPEEPETSIQGSLTVPAGWNVPPDALLNSARALLTQTVNPDEKKAYIILAQMHPRRLDFRPLYTFYGGAFVYPLGGALVAARVLGLATLKSDMAFYLAHPEAMGRLYLIGRLFVLLFHLAGIWVLYECGRVLSGRWAGTLAALLFALCPIVIAQSHVVKPHPAGAFWFLAGVWAMMRAIKGGRPADYVLCGACAGAAAGSVATTAFGAGMPALAWILRRDAGLRWALAGVAAAVAVFALCNPYLAADPRAYAWELGYIPMPKTLEPAAFVAGVGALFAGLGPLAAALSAGAAVLAVLRRDPSRRALGLLAIGGALLVWARFPALAASVGTLRFGYPLLGLGFLLGADAIVAARPRWLAAGLAAAVLVDGGVRSTATLENLRREAGPDSTRAAAADWIDANVPAGARVGLVRFPEPAHTPPFSWSRYELVVFDKPSSLRGDAPEWLVGRQGVVDALGDWATSRYATAASFPPARPLWGEPRDDAFFANAGMVVLRRR